MALAPYVAAERVAALCDRLDELVAEARALITTPATASASPAGVPGLDEGSEPEPEPVEPAAAGDASPAAVNPATAAPAVTNGGEPR